MKFKLADLDKQYQIQLTRDYGPYMDKPWLLKGRYTATLAGITHDGKATCWLIKDYHIMPADVVLASGQTGPKPKPKPTLTIITSEPRIIGKIWLVSGQILEFAWYSDFFVARAHYEKKRQIVRTVRSRWGCHVPPPSYASQRR